MSKPSLHMEATSVRNFTEAVRFQFVTWAHMALAGKMCEKPHWMYRRSTGSVLSLHQNSVKYFSAS